MREQQASAEEGISNDDVPSSRPPAMSVPSLLYRTAVTEVRPGFLSDGLITVFCVALHMSHTLTVPSAELVTPLPRSVGCQHPSVQLVIWPVVFFRSRIYMSPRGNSPSWTPSRE